MQDDYCLACNLHFEIAQLQRSSEYPKYCVKCVEIVTRSNEEEKKYRAKRFLEFLNSGALRSTLVGKSFDMSQEESRKACAEYIADFVSNADTWYTLTK